MILSTKAEFAKVEVGSVVRIEPIDKFPNAERKFKVDEVLDDGFLYGLSETCDGYVMPFNWIKELSVSPPVQVKQETQSKSR